MSSAPAWFSATRSGRTETRSLFSLALALGDCVLLEPISTRTVGLLPVQEPSLIAVTDISSGQTNEQHAARHAEMHYEAARRVDYSNDVLSD
jgi:hypothetical protein